MIDVAKLRDLIPSARDVLASGESGVVLVFETDGNTALWAHEKLRLMLEILRSFAGREIGYFSTAFNANAYSLHCRLADAEEVETVGAEQTGER